MKINLTVSILAVLTLAACVKESAPKLHSMTAVSFTFGASDLTRSSCVGSENSVENLIVAWYESGSLRGTTVVEGDSGSLSVFPGDYVFYAVANLETFVFPSSEADLGATGAAIDAPSDLRSLPMSAGPVPFSVPLSGSSISFSARRLAAKFSFSVDSSSLPGSFLITSLKIRQNASRLLPFSTSSAASPSEVSDCDSASSSDLSALNSGGVVTLYVPENVKGNHPGVDSPEKKDYDYIFSNISETLASTATFLELCGEWSGVGISAPVTYRMYLGANPRDDFNVIGNTEYTIHLRFDTSPIDQYVNAPVPVWMMEVSAPSDARELHWDNSSPFLLPGGYETLYYTVSPSGTEYTIEIDDGIALVDGDFVRGDSGINYYLDREGGFIEISRREEDSSSGIITCRLSTVDGLNCDESTIYKLGFNNTVSYFAFSDDYSEPITSSGLHSWNYDFSDVVFVSDFDPGSTTMTSSVQDHSLFTEYGSGRIIFTLSDYFYDSVSNKLSAVYSIDLNAMKEADNLYVWLWNMTERSVTKSISVDIEYFDDGLVRHSGGNLCYDLTPYTGTRYPVYTSSTWGDIFSFEENFYLCGSQYYYPTAALDQCIVSAYSESVTYQEQYVTAYIEEAYSHSSGNVVISPYGGNTAGYDSDGLVYFNVLKFYGNLPSEGVESILISIN